MESPVPWIPTPSFFTNHHLLYPTLCLLLTFSCPPKDRDFPPGSELCKLRGQGGISVLRFCKGSSLWETEPSLIEKSQWSSTPNLAGPFRFIFCCSCIFSEVSSHLSEHSHSESSFSKRVVLHFWADFLPSPGLWWHKTDRSNAGCVHTAGGWPRNCGHPRCLPETRSTPVAWGAGFHQTLCQMICSNSTESILPDGNHHITALFPWNMHKASWACELYTEAKVL